MSILKSFSIFLFLAFSITVKAQLKLPALVSDSMVLQRDMPVKIWGWSFRGEVVTVSFKNKKYSAMPDGHQKWTITLDPTKAGGPYNITVNTSTQKIELKNVLFGDVWLCSGQSNMEFSMSKLASKYPDDIANSTNPLIREFHVNTQYKFHPDSVCTGKWVSANPKSVRAFTAVGYYMVRELYEKYKIPMGIIHSSWGGTPVESWISEEGFNDFKNYLDKYHTYQDPSIVESTIRKDKDLQADWYTNIQANDKGLKDKIRWTSNEIDISGWRNMNVPGFWEQQGAKDVDGVVWLKKKIILHQSMPSTDAMLDLGFISDLDTTYVNGIKVGSTNNKYIVRKYRVPAGLLKEGENVISIRIVNFNGDGGVIKGNKYLLTGNNQEIDLSGEWKYEVGVATKPLPEVNKFWTMPVTLYNGMISPLIPYTIKGVAWYQGESNTSRAAEYLKLLPAMITDWRTRWGQGNFPFLIVQLANFLEPKALPTNSNWALLRESQLKVSQNVPNCGLAVTIDVGESYNIHPLDKFDVGKRLALVAQNIAYGDKKITDGGPSYQSMKIDDSKIILSFEKVGKGLINKGGAELSQFAIAGDDRKFVWANAKIAGNQVVVWSDTVLKPVAVRYGWADNPAGANLYNKDGLPASPFRTDQWAVK